MSNFLSCQLYDQVGVFTVFPYHHFNGCNIWSVSLSLPDIADTCLLSIHLYLFFQSILLIVLMKGIFVLTNLDSIFKSRDITLPTKVRLVKAMVLPVVMYKILRMRGWT